MSYSYNEPDPMWYNDYEPEEEDYDFWDERADTGEGIGLYELLDLVEEATPKGLMTADEYDGYLDWKGEYEAEQAWLRSAENSGWQEAHMESLFESGLRARWY